MKLVGKTTSGSVLVEMSAAQFDNLSQFIQPLSGESEAVEEIRPPAAGPAPAMVLKKRLESIRRCLAKLSPPTLEDLEKTIRLVCSHTGGVRDRELAHIIDILEKERYLKVGSDERVTYY